jgi:hypothetical protein
MAGRNVCNINRVWRACCLNWQVCHVPITTGDKVQINKWSLNIPSIKLHNSRHDRQSQYAVPINTPGLQEFVSEFHRYKKNGSNLVSSPTDSCKNLSTLHVCCCESVWNTRGPGAPWTPRLQSLQTVWSRQTSRGHSALKLCVRNNYLVPGAGWARWPREKKSVV